ncbi:MAG: PilZ domain-containing protein [Desulfobulbaceae bacterium]|nr:PilZ domain-containing protein [Desulfobulbaceae bacterium]
MHFDRRKEKRQACNLNVGVFLSEGKNGPAITPSFQGQLLNISRRGADIALDEIMYDRTHLALAPMESKLVVLNVVLPAEDVDNPLTVSALPVWFDKKFDTELPPFRIGLHFTEILTSKQYQIINNHCS